MADEEQMIKVHEMEDHTNADILTFNPGGKQPFLPAGH